MDQKRKTCQLQYLPLPRIVDDMDEPIDHDSKEVPDSLPPDQRSIENANIGVKTWEGRWYKTVVIKTGINESTAVNESVTQCRSVRQSVDYNYNESDKVYLQSEKFSEIRYEIEFHINYYFNFYFCNCIDIEMKFIKPERLSLKSKNEWCKCKLVAENTLFTKHHWGNATFVIGKIATKNNGYTFSIKEINHVDGNISVWYKTQK